MMINVEANTFIPQEQKSKSSSQNCTILQRRVKKILIMCVVLMISLCTSVGLYVRQLTQGHDCYDNFLCIKETNASLVLPRSRGTQESNKNVIDLITTEIWGNELKITLSTTANIIVQKVAYFEKDIYLCRNSNNSFNVTCQITQNCSALYNEASGKTNMHIPVNGDLLFNIDVPCVNKTAGIKMVRSESSKM